MPDFKYGDLTEKIISKEIEASGSHTPIYLISIQYIGKKSHKTFSSESSNVHNILFIKSIFEYAAFWIERFYLEDVNIYE